MEIWNQYLRPFVYLLVEMAPYLLLGLLIAGILHVFVPKAWYQRYLAQDNLASVLRAILLGVPLPLCSCGVIPTAVGMRKEGASPGATTAFLIATPQTGVDSILATYAVFGLPFALLRPIVAMITGVVGGVVTNVVAPLHRPPFLPRQASPLRDAERGEGLEASKGKLQRRTLPLTGGDGEGLRRAWDLGVALRAALKYGFSDMLIDIGQWLLVGILLAGLITIFVPEGFFLTYCSSPLMSMFIVLLIACPMYVCATGSIPIAAALMLKGLSPGAALVFLMAGPATNMASMMVLGGALGRRSLVAYVLTILFGAITAGLVVDYALPAEWFSGVMLHAHHGACCVEETIPWWQIVCTLLFVVLLLRALYLRFTGHDCGCGEEHGACGHCSCGDDHCSCGDDHCSCGDDHCSCGDDHCSCGDEHCSCGDDHCSCADDHCSCGDDHCSCADDHCSCGDDHCSCADDHCSCGQNASPSQARRIEVVTLKVEGMMCNHCRAHVAEALARVEGVEDVSVDLATGMAKVKTEGSPIVCAARPQFVASLIAAVESCGYRAQQAEPPSISPR